ncbi:MAG: hypothetical protein EON57_02365 [Alphaproteobacteria bacterium]|nr:MAG: hypothetical protein EON57_02365 [Alphaproteobacteria bacterium]
MSSETNTPASAGGELVERPFIRLRWQKGLPTEAGVNGCRVEDVLSVAADKLRSYQDGPLACPENEDALNALEPQVKTIIDAHLSRVHEISTDFIRGDVIRVC